MKYYRTHRQVDEKINVRSLIFLVDACSVAAGVTALGTLWSALQNYSV